MFRNCFIGVIFLSICASCSYTDNNSNGELSKIATQINQKCPQMLDSETRFEGIEVKEPNTLVYKYSLVNVLSKNVDTVQFYRALWPGIISNIKVSPEMKKLRLNNTVIEYLYQDKNNQLIYTFKISPEDYR